MRVRTQFVNDGPGPAFEAQYPGVFEEVTLAAMRNGSFGKDHVLMVMRVGGRWTVAAREREDLLKSPGPLPFEALETIQEPAMPHFLHVLVFQPDGSGFSCQLMAPHKPQGEPS